jgi:hypothetical protein
MDVKLNNAKDKRIYCVNSSHVGCIEMDSGTVQTTYWPEDNDRLYTYRDP